MKIIKHQTNCLITCFSILCTFLQFNQYNTQTPLTVYSQPQTFSLDSSSTIPFTNAVNLNSTSQLFVNNFYIIRKSSKGGLTVWDIKTKLLRHQLLIGSSFESTEVCKQFDMAKNQNKTLIVLTVLNRVLIINLLSINLATVLNTIYLPYPDVRDVAIAGKEILVFSYQANGISKIIRYNFGGGKILTALSSISNQPLYRLNTCQPAVIPTVSSYIVTIYRDNCFVQVFQCIFGSSCSSLFSRYAGLCDWLATTPSNYDIEYSSDCSQLIFHDYLQGAKVLNISSRKLTQTFPTTSSLSVTQMAFLDSENKFIAVTASDGTYSIYQYTPVTADYVLYSGSLGLSDGLFVQYNQLNKQLIVSGDSSIHTYDLGCSLTSSNILTLSVQGLCVGCDLTHCSQSDIYGQCVSCLSGYSINLVSGCSVCELTSVVADNSSNATTGGNSSAPGADTTNSTKIPENDTMANNSTPSETANSDDTIVQPIYDYQQKMGSIIRQTFAQTLINSAVVGITFLQLFPFSFLFMRFINFWSICSFYLLLEIKLPKYLHEIIAVIYQGINKPLSQALNANLTFQLGIQEKYQGNMLQKYKLNSDFINSNFENLAILFFSYFVLVFFYVLARRLTRKNIVGRVLFKIDFPMAVLGQYVGIMSGFYLNLHTIQYNCYQRSFVEKVNLSLTILFIAVSNITPGIALLYIEKHCRNQSQIHQNKKQKREWLINILYNSMMPFTAIFGNLYLFLALNAGLYLFQFYSASKQKKFKANYVILSLFLVLFHIGFITLNIFGPQDYEQIYHHTGLVMIAILFVGAIYELLTLIFGIIYDIFCALVSYFSRVTDHKLSNIYKHRKRQSQTMMNSNGPIDASDMNIKDMRFIPKKIKKIYFQNAFKIANTQHKQIPFPLFQVKPKMRDRVSKQYVFNNKLQKNSRQFLDLHKLKRKIQPLKFKFERNIQNQNITQKINL